MAHIEEIGELEGKKSFFEDKLNIKAKEIGKETRQLSFRFSSTSFTSTV